MNTRAFFGSAGSHQAHSEITTVLEQSTCCDAFPGEYPDYVHWLIVAIEQRANWGRF
jgi:hypothetical protein